MLRMVVTAALAALSISSAYAQGGYTVYTPGQIPRTVSPNSFGGYTVQTPGQLPTTITPNGSPYRR